MGDIEIHVTGGNQLMIKGVRRQPAGITKSSFLRQERSFGNFARTLTLPVPVDASKVEARLVQGVGFHRRAVSRRRRLPSRDDPRPESGCE